MRIVTDGKKYAIEKGWIFKKYASLNLYGIWWPYDRSLESCWGSERQIADLYNFLMRKKNIRKVDISELEKKDESVTK